MILDVFIILSSAVARINHPYTVASGVLSKSWKQFFYERGAVLYYRNGQKHVIDRKVSQTL